MKKNTKKDEFLEQLRKIPIIQVACEKVGLSRTSIYRWKDEDEEFKKDMEKALAEGESFVNDMSESQVLALIKDQNWSAISFWLKHHHPAYRNRVEVTAVAPQEELTSEQEGVVREALRLASLPLNTIENDPDVSTQSNSTRTGGEDDQGREDKDGDNQE